MLLLLLLLLLLCAINEEIEDPRSLERAFAKFHLGPVVYFAYLRRNWEVCVNEQ
jgi:hypothetical protein